MIRTIDKFTFTKYYSEKFEFGLYLQEKDLYVEPHKHEYIEIVVQLEGFSNQIIDNNNIMLHKGEFLIINSNQIHENPPSTYHAINLLISKTLLSNLVIESAYDSKVVDLKEKISNYIHTHKYTMTDEAFQHILEMTFKYQNEKDQDFYYLLQRNSLIVLLTMLYSTTEFSIIKPNVVDYDIFTYIYDNLQTASLKEYADTINFSLSSTSLKIKKEYGMTFVEILHEIRIKTACELLLNSKTSIDYIILEVGYDNKTYFYKLFRRKFSMSPKQFRAKHSTLS